MKISPVIALIAAAVAFVPDHADAASFVATSAGLDAVNARILTEHNAVRAEVGAPPLQWDPSLAVAAASYGPALSRIGHLVHSPRTGRENQRENLWMGQDGRFRPGPDGRRLDRREAPLLPGAFPNVSRPGTGRTSRTIPR